jgi:hypothetical protein
MQPREVVFAVLMPGRVASGVVGQNMQPLGLGAVVLSGAGLPYVLAGQAHTLSWVLPLAMVMALAPHLVHVGLAPDVSQ